MVEVMIRKVIEYKLGVLKYMLDGRCISDRNKKH